MESEYKVYKKRPHRKVKTGCITCKRRKVKCDEGKPQCSNCIRYDVGCIYPSQIASESLSHDLGSSSASMTDSLERTPEKTADEPLPTPLNTSLNLSDLALLHQWTISTCYGFGDGGSNDHRPWQVDIPLIGQKCPFVMRGILAVSALHLCRLAAPDDHPTRFNFVKIAFHHQDLALPEYRAAISNVTEENCHALMAFSVLTTVYSFAVPKKSGALFSGDITESILLHRGQSSIPPEWLAWAEKGPMKDQLKRRQVQPVDATLNPDDYRLVGLHGMLTNLPLDQQGEAVHYDLALQWLRQAFAMTYAPNTTLGPKYAALYWLDKVDPAFLDLLAMKKPRALVLLAHFAILIKKAEGKSWYLEGFAEYIVSELKPKLGDEFLPWIEWPLVFCGIDKTLNTSSITEMSAQSAC